MDRTEVSATESSFRASDSNNIGSGVQVTESSITGSTADANGVTASNPINPNRRSSISSLSSVGTGVNNSTNGMQPNITGNSILSSRVQQSRHFGSSVNQMQNLSSAFTNDQQQQQSLHINTTNATIASNSNTDILNHSQLNDHSLNAADFANMTTSTIADSALDRKPQPQQQTIQIQQPNLTGSTNNSFSQNWLLNSQHQNQYLSQQQQQAPKLQQNSSLLNVTPWIEQQAQVSPFHHQYSINALSSHSTGNTISNSNLNELNQNLTTNLSLLTSNSSALNPLNQHTQQMRQPQFYKNSTVNSHFNPSPPNNNNESLNTSYNYQNYQSFQPYQSYATSNASTTNLNKLANTTNNDSNAVNNDEEDEEELIPTAIVIKNIPFAVKKEQLLDILSKLNLPLPYAFNYHFDNGVFRGLAFANFNSIEETALVVSMMNGREIDGRKLRVEYKKMLPLQERERIEREKKEKKCQLEEQHRNTSITSLASLYSAASVTQAGFNGNGNAGGNQSIGNNNVPVSVAVSAADEAETSNIDDGNLDEVSVNTNAAPEKNVFSIPKLNQLSIPPSEVDFNNPEILEIYTRLVLFKEDSSSELTINSASLSTNGRTSIKHLTSFLNLCNVSTNSNGNIVIQKQSSSRQQSRQPTGGSISGSNNTVSNISSAGSNLTYQPHHSLIRSQSHNLLNSNPGLNLNTNRFRQQSPRTVSQTQQYGFNNQPSSLGLNLSNMTLSGLQQQSTIQGSGLGHQQQQQQQQQLQQSQQPQLHHSSSNASLNLLRSKGLTAPTTPNAGRQATFGYNSQMVQQQQQQQQQQQAPQQQHFFYNTPNNNGFNNPQITGGSNISLNMNMNMNMSGKGMDDLYSGIECLSFDNNGTN